MFSVRTASLSIIHIEILKKYDMKSTNKAAIIGATGLIGNEILQILEQSNSFSEIILITRRNLSFSNPKITVCCIDFSNFSEFENALKDCNTVFCAVGTTQKKVKGNKTEYRKVDFDIPVTAARICEQNGISHFSLVSSVGANSKSSNFYLKLKGEVEDAVSKFSIPSVAIYRPSMLLGNRKEFRFGELISKIVTIPAKFLIPSKYKPIQAIQVAKAMIRNAQNSTPGISVYHYKEITTITHV